MHTLRWKAYLPAIVWFFILLFLLMLPGNEFPNPIPWMQKIHFDKWVHAGLFAVLTWLWLYPIIKKDLTKKETRTRIWITVSLVVIWGITTEYIQDKFIPFRSFEWGDWAADAAGACLGALYFNYFTLKKHKKRISSFK